MMRVLKPLFWPLQLFRNLPIGWKLATTIAGALAMLSSVSWFALDRLTTVGALQDSVGEQAALERQVQRGMAAALELRVISRELQTQQTLSAVNKVAAQADETTAIARDWFVQAQRGAKGLSEQKLLTQTLARLEETATAVRREVALRSEMLTARQKRLFQVRPLMATSMQTFAQEIAQGGAMLGGADSVRSDGSQAAADASDPLFAAFTRYRLAIGRMQEAAMMFMATGNGAAANEVRESTNQAAQAMEAIQNSDASDALKSSARTVGTIGAGMAQTALDLIAQTRQLDDVAHHDVEAASQAMLKAITDLARTAALRDSEASDLASEARTRAQQDMWILVGGMAVAMLITGAAITHLIAAPLRGLTRCLRSIAAGDTGTRVDYRDQRDEIGQMAGAVETLRATMRQAFLQSQMIDQIPVPVMTAAAGEDGLITYLNPEAKRVLGLIKDHLPVPPDRIIGQSLDIFHADKARERALMADPRTLPRRSQIVLGDETLECHASAIHDRHGAFVGPMVTWHVLTARTRLVARFEQSVGVIANAVGESAETMTQAAVTMNEAVADSGQRIIAVTGASEDASGHVSAAAAGAEQLAMSVAEIGRQVSESARIAGQAVREAEATDHSVSGLSQAAERIGDVVRLIGDIAARTNLLALNATIEAARAGEAGKGFAVVASEVKTLATQTAKATQDIAVQIGGMQQSAGQAATALRGIGATIQRMNEIATAIAGAVEQQGAATQEIARAVQQAASGTNEVNGNIAVVSQSVGHTGAQADMVLRAATRLSEQSATLKAEASRFLTAVREAA